MKSYLSTILIAGSLLAAPLAMAQYSLIDDFESYTLGTYNGGSTAFIANGGPWESNVGGGTGLVSIEADASPTNRYAAFGWNSGQRGIIRNVTAISQGGVGSYYFQIRTEDATPDVSYGLTDIAPGAFGYGDFEVQVSLTYSPETGIRLGARNGALFTTFEASLVTNLAANTWYDIWVMVNNSTDTYDVYYGTGGDPETLGTLIANDYQFRNGVAANDLISFLTLSNNHEDNNANLDNVYYNPEVVGEPPPFVIESTTPIGANASAVPVLKAVVVDGTASVDTGSFVLSLDGSTVAHNLSSGGGTSTVSFATATILDPLTVHTGSVYFTADSGTYSTNRTWTFTVKDYDTLSADWSYALSNTNSGTRGFWYRDVNHSGNPINLGSETYILSQLAGKLSFTNNSAAGPVNGYYRLPEDSASGSTDVINFNITPDGPASQHGNFYAAATAPLNVPESAFEGFDNTLYPFDFVSETLTYLELDPGYYNLGINCDDSYLIYMGEQPLGLFAPKLGQRLFYSGSDSVISFKIDTAGLYPFRLVQAQGGGGAGLELFTVAQDGTRTLVNDAGGVRAWRVAPGAPPYLSWLDPADGSVTTNDTITIEITDGDSILGAYTLTKNGSPVSPSDSKSGDVTTLTTTLDLGTNAFELVFSGITNTFDVTRVEPPSITYVDASHTNNTTAWDTNTSTFVAWNPPVDGSYGDDDQWEFETPFGNGGIYESNSENPTFPEDAPRLKTTVTGLEDGTYNVYVYFWSWVASWEIQAAVTNGPGNLPSYLGGSSPSTDVVEHYLAINPGDTFADLGSPVYSTSMTANPFTNEGGVMIAEGNRRLFQGYLGTVTVSGGSLTVYVDDNNAAVDNGDRTWYDGIGYEPASGPAAAPVINSITVAGGMVTINWDSDAVGTYEVQTKTDLTQSGWTAVPGATGLSGGAGNNTSFPVSGDDQEFFQIEGQ